MKKFILILLIVILTDQIFSNDMYFNDFDIKNVYEDVKDVLSKPLYNINQIDSDIKNVIEILNQSKIPHFTIGIDNKLKYNYYKNIAYPIIWYNGQLTFESLNERFVSILTADDAAKYELHKHLSLLLKAAKQEMLRKIEEDKFIKDTYDNF